MNETFEQTSPRTEGATWHKSRWSAVKWGCHRQGILPCLPDCPYAFRMGCAGHARHDGSPCPIEQAEADFYRQGFEREFARAGRVLGDIEFRDLVEQLAVLHLRRERLMARFAIAMERYVRREYDDIWAYDKEARLVHKYQTTALHTFLRILQQLRVASRSPYEGWEDWHRVMYLREGIGPACDIKTREIVWEAPRTFDKEPVGPASPYANPEHWRYHW